jgi:hypothetical protein
MVIHSKVAINKSGLKALSYFFACGVFKIKLKLYGPSTGC